ncbi:MAG: hypothetical protein LBV03_06370 [Fusobacteriales bacterium]|jgi:hypothetical protein|nr:hypothetical protein [Fusobacteriales bacterium]
MNFEKIKGGIDTALKIESEARKLADYNSEIEETDKLMKKLHEEYFETVNLWAYKKSISIGKTAAELKKSNLSFAEFFKLQGLTKAEYTQLSMEFAELSYDMASKHGFTAEKAAEILKSAIQREEEALKFLNVTLDTKRLNRLSNDKAVLNTSGIILNESSGIRGTAEIEKTGYKDKKDRFTENFKEVGGRTAGKALTPFYEDIFDLVNPILEQGVLSLQKTSDMEMNNIIRTQELNLKDRIENYKKYMDKADENPEYKELASKEYQELKKFLPKFMETIPDTKEGAQILYENSESLLEELRVKIRSMIKDKNFETDKEKIKQFKVIYDIIYVILFNKFKRRI